MLARLNIDRPCHNVLTCFLPASWEELIEHTKHSWQYPLVEAPTQLNTVSNVHTDQMLKGIRFAPH